MDRGVVRSFTTELLTTANRDALPDILKKVEASLSGVPNGMPPPPTERTTIPRFRELFVDGDLLPPAVFVCALEMKETEVVNGQGLQFDSDVVQLRDRLVLAYKPVLTAARIPGKEIMSSLLQDFCILWFTWEAAWLRNREVHSVQTLQPLCNAILSLEPLVHSKKKERLFPHPQVIQQKVISCRCLEGFLNSFTELCSVILSSLQRVMDHDIRLLVLVDHFAHQDGENETIGDLILGTASTPGILFIHSSGEKMDLEQYSISLGTNPIYREKSLQVLESFDAVVKILFGIQTHLHDISPNLDCHPALVKSCAQFERSFRQARKLFLEPSNLV